MELENKLFLIAIKKSLGELTNEVNLTKWYEVPYDMTEFSYADLIEHDDEVVEYSGLLQYLYIVMYDQDRHYYSVTPLCNDVDYYTEKEKNLFNYMDFNHIRFIGDNNPLGQIFHSYAAVWLEIVRWAADVAYTKRKMQQLVED